MNYFFQPDLNYSEKVISLNADESHHAAKVLRCKPGESAGLVNGKGLKAEAIFKGINPKESILEVTRFYKDENPRVKISIAIANLKNRDRLEWFVEKAVELGAAEVTVFLSARTEKFGMDDKRLERIAISALKQSGSLWLPEIQAGVKYADVLKEKKNLLIAHCSEKYPAALLKNVYTPRNDVTVLIGPEGDFTDEEIEAAISAGATPVSLGPYRLRAETAAMAALVMVQVGNM